MVDLNNAELNNKILSTYQVRGLLKMEPYGTSKRMQDFKEGYPTAWQLELNAEAYNAIACFIAWPIVNNHTL